MWPWTCSFPGCEGVRGRGGGLRSDSLLLLSVSQSAKNMCSLVAGLPFSTVRWRSLISGRRVGRCAAGLWASFSLLRGFSPHSMHRVWG